MLIKVEIVYIPKNSAAIYHEKIDLPAGATVLDALHSSGLARLHPETLNMEFGIFAKLVSLDTVLRAGDRVEIYSPLIFDPKENRRQRAKLQKSS